MGIIPADRPSSRLGVDWMGKPATGRWRPWRPAGAPGGRLVAGLLAVGGLPPVDLHGPLHDVGIMDPLCGMTRGTAAVLRGQLGRALAYNPASPLVVAAATLMLGRWLVGRLTGRRLEVRVQPAASPGVGVVALLIL
jgi:hypothetical protein